MKLKFSKYQPKNSEAIYNASIKKESTKQESTLHSEYIYAEPIVGRVGSEFNQNAHIPLSIAICNPAFKNKFAELGLPKKVLSVLTHDKAFYNKYEDKFMNDIDVNYDKELYLIGQSFAKYYLTSERYKQYITANLVETLSKVIKTLDDKRGLKEMYASTAKVDESIMKIDFDGADPQPIRIIGDLTVGIKSLTDADRLEKKLKDFVLRKTSSVPQLYKLYKNPSLIDRLYLESVHVIPLGYRQKIDNRISPITKVYTDIINKSNALKGTIVTRPSMEVLFRSLNELTKSVATLLIADDNVEDVQFKSIKSVLSGKDGHLKGEMYSTRIDLSGRSVIVGDPKLSVDEIRIPIETAIKLNEVNLAREAIRKELKSLDELSYQDKVKLTLEQMKEEYVIIGRQPTLFRLSIQAFKVKISMEQKAIALSPLIVAGYNADFDGDQMHISIPVTKKAKIDVATRMCNLHNLLAPKDGVTHVAPRLDIKYGLYNIIKNPTDTNTEEYVNVEETLKGVKSLRAKCGNYTLGMKALSEILGVNPELIKGTSVIVDRFTELLKTDQSAYINCVNQIVALGFLGAMQASPSLSILGSHRLTDDERFPPELISELNAIDKLANKGLLLDRQVDRLRQGVYDKVEEAQANLFNQYYSNTGYSRMVESGARGTKSSLHQIFMSKGTIDKGDGSVLMVNSSLVDQLKSMDSFVLAYNGRAGVMAKALEVSKPGYLSNVLAKSSQNIVINKSFCGTKESISLTRKMITDVYGAEITDGHIVSIVSEIIKGRYYLQGSEPVSTEVLNGSAILDLINTSKGVQLLSPLTCESQCCQMCYGTDMSTDELVKIGTAIGMNSSQSISEPSTQLSMNKFKRGSAVIEQDAFEIAEKLLFLSYSKDKFIQTTYLSPISGKILKSYVNQRYSNFLIIDEETGEKTKMMKVSSRLKLKEYVNKGETIFNSQDVLFSPRDYMTYYGELNGLLYTSLLTYAVFGEVGINFKHFETVFSALRKYVVIKSDKYEEGRHVTHAEKMLDKEGSYYEIVASAKESIKYNKCMMTALLFEDIIAVMNYNIFFDNDNFVVNPIARIALGQMPMLGSWYDKE